MGAGKCSIIPKIDAARREITELRRFGTFFLVLWGFVALVSARTSPRQRIPDVVARCVAERAGGEGLPFSTLDLLRRRRLPTRSRSGSPARHQCRSIAHPLWEGLARLHSSFARGFDTTGLLPRTNTLCLKILRPGRTKRLSLTTTIDPFVFAGVFRRCNDLRVR